MSVWAHDKATRTHGPRRSAFGQPERYDRHNAQQYSLSMPPSAASYVKRKDPADLRTLTKTEHSTAANSGNRERTQLRPRNRSLEIVDARASPSAQVAGRVRSSVTETHAHTKAESEHTRPDTVLHHPLQALQAVISPVDRHQDFAPLLPGRRYGCGSLWFWCPWLSSDRRSPRSSIRNRRAPRSLHSMLPDTILRLRAGAPERSPLGADKTLTNIS